jgi:hypothetical protein
MAYKGVMDTFDVVVTARSNGELNSEQFDRQVAMIRPVMTWDPVTTLWHNRLSGSHAEHLSNVLNTLFERPHACTGPRSPCGW